MLFILYVNDLPYKSGHEDKPVMYADDTSILITAKNEAELKDNVKPSFHDGMGFCKRISIKHGKNKYNEIYFQ
jgi:hypothetical protein